MSDQANAETRDQDAPDVFISFSTKDREIVDRIAALLKPHYKLFYSAEQMRASPTRWEDLVHEKLDQCYAVLALESPNAWASDEVRPEWNFGRKREKLIFARIKPVEKKKRNYRYDQYHCANLCDWDFTAEGRQFRELLEALNAVVDLGRAGRALQKEAAPAAAAQLKSLMRNMPAPAADVAALPRPAPPIGEEESPLPAPDRPLQLNLETGDWNAKDCGAIVEKAMKTADIAAIRTAARAGNTDAQTVIAFAHLSGVGEHRNLEAAARWLQKASSGNPRAKAELAYLLATRGLGETTLAQIDDSSRDAAASNCARAKTLRALIRLSGVSLPTLATDAAVRLLEQAGADGDLLGAANFGWSLLYGRGVQRNPARACEVLRAAAQAGEPRAMTYFGMMHTYAHGVPRDSTKAAHWFREAARRGDSWGEFYYGWINEIGFGVPTDAGEARRWYRKAALHDDIDAHVRLARMLLDGRGGVADATEAAKLLEPAAAVGEEVAASLLARLYEEGRGVAKDMTQALELYRVAADGDEPHALFKLGGFYENGRGVERSLDKALSYFRRAAFNTTDKKFYATILQKLSHYGAPLRVHNS